MGGSFSMMEMMVALYHHFLEVDPADPKREDRDIFVLSKGHAGVGYCVLLGDLGFFDESELDQFNQTGSVFGVHPDRKGIPGVEASTGSLGHGLGLSMGIALAKRMEKRPERVVCLMSDGECAEGSVWEALLASAHYRLGNLVAIIDYNKMTQDGAVHEIMGLEPLRAKVEAFGWRVIEIDGHDMAQVVGALEQLPSREQARTHAEPTLILMHTIKGKGIPWMENTVLWHYGGFDSDTEERALKDLDAQYAPLIAEYQHSQGGAS